MPEPLAGAPPATNAYDVAEADAYKRVVTPKPTAAAYALPRRLLQRSPNFLEVHANPNPYPTPTHNPYPYRYPYPYP